MFTSMVDRAVAASQSWRYNDLITHMTGMFIFDYLGTARKSVDI
jgi:hypothetical protein